MEMRIRKHAIYIRWCYRIARIRIFLEIMHPRCGAVYLFVHLGGIVYIYLSIPSPPGFQTRFTQHIFNKRNLRRPVEQEMIPKRIL